MCSAGCAWVTARTHARGHPHVHSLLAPLALPPLGPWRASTCLLLDWHRALCSAPEASSFPTRLAKAELVCDIPDQPSAAVGSPAFWAAPSHVAAAIATAINNYCDYETVWPLKFLPFCAVNPALCNNFKPTASKNGTWETICSQTWTPTCSERLSMSLLIPVPTANCSWTCSLRGHISLYTYHVVW